MARRQPSRPIPDLDAFIGRIGTLPPGDFARVFEAVLRRLGEYGNARQVTDYVRRMAAPVLMSPLPAEAQRPEATLALLQFAISQCPPDAPVTAVVEQARGRHRQLFFDGCAAVPLPDGATSLRLYVRTVQPPEPELPITPDLHQPLVNLCHAALAEEQRNGPEATLGAVYRNVALDEIRAVAEANDPTVTLATLPRVRTMLIDLRSILGDVRVEPVLQWLADNPPLE